MKCFKIEVCTLSLGRRRAKCSFYVFQSLPFSKKDSFFVTGGGGGVREGGRDRACMTVNQARD